MNCEASDIALFADMFSKTHTGSLLATRRIGIDGTLHRLSVILSHRTNAEGMPPVIGVTARVGRTVEGMLDALAPDLINSDESILLIGRPNTGKTTALREFARRLSEDKKVSYWLSRIFASRGSLTASTYAEYRGGGGQNVRDRRGRRGAAPGHWQRALAPRRVLQEGGPGPGPACLATLDFRRLAPTGAERGLRRAERLRGPGDAILRNRTMNHEQRSTCGPALGRGPPGPAGAERRNH